jgi:hypothetical protein
MREGSRLQADSDAGQVIEGAVRAAPSLATTSEKGRRVDASASDGAVKIESECLFARPRPPP